MFLLEILSQNSITFLLACNHDYKDPEYDRALHRYFWTYHNLVDLMVRVAVNEVKDSKPFGSFSTFLLPVVKTKLHP